MQSLVMPAWTDRFYGVKIINIQPANSAKGLPGLHAVYTLFDAATGVPLAFVDADELTARRTAAASALGADLLASPGGQDLLIVGAGRVARLLADAFAAVRPLSRIRIWARDPVKAQQLAATLVQDGHAAEVATDLEGAVRTSTLISCATLSEEALIMGDWLRPGTHLDLIGSFAPHMRETNARCFARAEVFADTDEAATKSGDILAARAEGALAPDGIRATLTPLVRGDHSGRSGPDAITLFKAVGSALEDLAGAALTYTHGRDRT